VRRHDLRRRLTLDLEQLLPQLGIDLAEPPCLLVLPHPLSIDDLADPRDAVAKSLGGAVLRDTVRSDGASTGHASSTTRDRSGFPPRREGRIRSAPSR